MVGSLDRTLTKSPRCMELRRSASLSYTPRRLILSISWDLCRVSPILANWRENWRSEEHTSELQSLTNLVCRLLLEKKKKKIKIHKTECTLQTMSTITGGC